MEVSVGSPGRGLVGLASVGTFAVVDVSSGEIPVVATEHSQFIAQTAANLFFQEEHGAFAEGDSETWYCVPDAVYDPPSVIPMYVANYGPFGTHLSFELCTDKRAGFTAFPGPHGGVFATVPGNLTSAVECRMMAHTASL